MDTSFLGLTVKEHEGYIKKAITEVPLKLENTKFRRAAARTLRAWKAQRDANHTKVSSHDVQGLAPGRRDVQGLEPGPR